MEKKNTLLLTVIAVATLLVAVVGATFAYFGSFTTDTTNTAAVNVHTDPAVASSFVTTGGSLDISVASKDMTRDLSGVVTKVAENNVTLGIELDAKDPTTVTTCNYNIFFQYDTGSAVYQNDKVEGKAYVTPGLAEVVSDVSTKEFTYTITKVDATQTGGTASTLTIEEAFKNADSSFADFEGAGTKKVKVASGTIIADKTATAKVVQELKVNVKFYNFPTLDQSQLSNKDFKGKFFVDNDIASDTKVVCTTTAE